MTEWKEYKVHINKEAEDNVVNLLIALGSNGVSIVDRTDFETLPEYGFDTLWELDENKFPKEGIIISGYFSVNDMQLDFDKVLHNSLEKLKKEKLNLEHYAVESTQIKDSDWENKWKEYYSSVQITRYLTIVPEWLTYEPKGKSEQLIIMDPGLAFGTGTHPTTQLSIQALELVMRGGEKVIDVGTGSGVLTIASSLLGAETIHAYDLDDIAIQSAENNINLNKLDSEIIIQQNNLLENIEIKADLIVANILANIILKLIKDAKSALNPGGYFISSGIIKEKQDEVVLALEKEGFKIQQINQMKDWIAIIAQKPFN